MNTLTIPKIDTQFEVIGFGKMPIRPMNVGEWWVAPADQYDSTIPPEAMRKLFILINQGVKFTGFVVADDIRKKELKEKRERRKKEIAKAVAGSALPILGTALTITVTIAMGMAYLFVAAFTLDPMLVGILAEDGRWICIHSWWD